MQTEDRPYREGSTHAVGGNLVAARDLARGLHRAVWRHCQKARVSVAQLWIGTSGWVYPHWLGVLYPPRTPSGRMLPLYADRFPTVEINRSYYRLPDRTVFEGWRAQAAPGFLLAVKASRFLTHMKKLKDPEEPLERLMSAAAGLEEKLGPVLFQFPRQWRLNLERLDGFLPLLKSRSLVSFFLAVRQR